MGTVFRKKSHRPIPANAEINQEKGKTLARWRVRGKLRTAQVTMGKDGTQRIVTQAKTFTAKYRAASGVIVERATGCRDEQAARQKLAGWMREQEQIDAGVLDQGKLDLVRVGESLLRPLIGEYESHLVASEVSAMYRKNVLAGIRRMATDCKFQFLKDLNANPVVNWLAGQVGEGMSARSRNHYRDCLIVFGNWCVDHKKCLAANPFTQLPNADRKTDPRRPSRALTDDELQRLLKVACERPLNDALTIRRGERRGELGAKIGDGERERLTDLGRERALIYKTLVLTGLRKNELASLTVGQFNYAPGGSFLTLKPKDEKNGKGSKIELTDDLADDLAGRVRGRPSSAKLLRLPSGLICILDRDLKAAGIPKIDDRGNHVHLHAMRKTTCTMLNRAGVPARVAQKIMRHSDIRLTMEVYTDEGQLDVRSALDRMPQVTMPGRGIQLLTQNEAHRNSDAPPDAPIPFNVGLLVTSPGMNERVFDSLGSVSRIDATAYPVNESAPLTSCDISEATSIKPKGENSATWTRTKNRPINSRMLYH